MENNMDEQIVNLEKADTIRASLLTGARKSIYSVDYPWTMMEEPWVCEWFDYDLNEICRINPIGNPIVGEELCMFVATDKQANVKNYIFTLSKYYTDKEGDK